MSSASQIRKWGITDALAVPSLSLPISGRQRYCFLIHWGSEKAPQDIDKHLFIGCDFLLGMNELR